MSIYIGDKEIKNLYVGDSSAKEAYLGENKVRPTITAGIYRNQTEGLISLSSDGSNWITIADKNLGATQVYNDGDVISNTNYGNFYQWGNNHGFAYSTGSYSPNSTSTIDASTYGPGNYYNSNTWRQLEAWESSNNANLWGETTNTNEARRGPCSEGWHIPSISDINTLKDIITSFGLSSSDRYLVLKAAYTFYKSYKFGNSYSAGELSWTSRNSGNNGGMYYSPGNNNTYSLVKGSGLPIRPFKNEAVQPDASRTKLY